MQTETIEFQQNVRRVYTAIKHLLYSKSRFKSIVCDDDRFRIVARRGGLLSPWSEGIQIKVVALAADASHVTIKSSSRSVLNLLNRGANKRNVIDLSDFIRNEVYKLVDDQVIRLRHT